MPSTSLQLMTSYFGHTHVCLADEEKNVTISIEKSRGLFYRGRISTFVTTNLSLSSN